MPDKGIVLKRTKSIDYSETPSENGSQADRVSLDKRSQNSEEMQTAFREEVSKLIDFLFIMYFTIKFNHQPSPKSTSEDIVEDPSSVWELHRSGQRVKNNYSDIISQGNLDSRLFIVMLFLL